MPEWVHEHFAIAWTAGEEVIVTLRENLSCGRKREGERVEGEGQRGEKDRGMDGWMDANIYQ